MVAAVGTRRRGWFWPRISVSAFENANPGVLAWLAINVFSWLVCTLKMPGSARGCVKRM